MNLDGLITAIEAGEFGTIISVLVAQSGELVDEHSCDAAGVDGLRNTRSATEAITGMLVGAAIADGKIADARVRVLPLLARVKAPENPDRT